EAEEPAGPRPAPVARAAEQEPIVDGASAVDAPEPEPAHEPPHRREVKKSRGRASVPSWDEIMFGGGKQD
ncbi:MAG TPA: hypothetical protein PLP61_15645, partial [Nocardioides sp.]|nr:hypothetical protein [Nocardioides sp.]